MATAIGDQEPRDFHLRWATLRPPQCPTPYVRDTIRALLAERPGPALQLGVTPAIADASAGGVAIDWNPDMLRLAWPGDSATHRAEVGNWLDLRFSNASFATAFGDGSLTMLDWPADYRLLMRSLGRVLRPGGRLVLRCFVRPDACEAIGDLAAEVLAGKVDHFGAFKLRLNMATAAIDGRVYVPVADIHAQFEAHLPDRAAIETATGWGAAEFAAIDAYRDAGSHLSYATRAEIASTLPEGATHRFVETEGYPLADRCPLLVVDFPT
ncbi:class I SAM-dependent methyltransferase [Sphingomonas sp. CGMCC 1.13654]|uniref:Class I SAM-dependent methyltransferase n=1 Tax=Sphingomonas chungangi TaxID=2683589 RepID=A0A838L395_9SPHN|nr:class I SAM-dependent methyltransferase [Sphingomonas chungangi]MBA2933135.1 class I SAM-dependent methyltransferase [Sphingomonas chungangi]MVW56755.1 hypothetical protein [Sphingomonas chungangi]